MCCINLQLYLDSFPEKMRGAGALIIKNEFSWGPETTHYSSWLLLTVWISLRVPELVHLSLSGVGPWQMCQYGCRSSVLGERHLNSPWCITLAATNLAELSSKSSYFPLPPTICFLSPDEVNVLKTGNKLGIPAPRAYTVSVSCFFIVGVDW